MSCADTPRYFRHVTSRPIQAMQEDLGHWLFVHVHTGLFWKSLAVTVSGDCVRKQAGLGGLGHGTRVHVWFSVYAEA